MKRLAPAVLVWIAVGYVIAQIALFVWMDESWQPTRVKVEHQKLRALRTLVASEPERPLVLMLGSSRTDWGFQAGKLNGQLGPDGRPILAYNLGVPTAGPMHEALYLRDLLADGIRPRLLLVEFVATHFNEPRRGLMSEEDMIDAPCLSASQLIYYAQHFSHPRKKVGQWIEGRLAPWYTFRYNFHHRLQETDDPNPNDPASRPMDEWGWRLLTTELPTEERRAARWAGAYAMYAASLQRFRFADGPTRAMHELLARCRDEQIPVALVHMPTCERFRNLYHPDAAAALRKFVDELRERYKPYLIDATNWLEEEEFDDGHHLLYSGACHFTARLIGEVQDLLVRSSSSDDSRSSP